MNSSHPYFGVEIVVTTKHDKAALLQPSFKDLLNITLVELPLDTDQLGTFAGEIERTAPPRETAIAKARLGIENSGNRFGIASEGSIAADFSLPWIHADYEVLVFIDAESNLVISETLHSREIVAASTIVRADDDIEKFVKRADFPRHALIAQPVRSREPFIVKGITTLNELVAAITECATKSPTGEVKLESDFRAMHSPSRQENIRTLGRKLATRIAALCPECNTPGWGVVDYEKGVPCIDCGELNREAISHEIVGCYRCNYKVLGATIKDSLDPAQCHFCNP
jgi:hypothetical protein